MTSTLVDCRGREIKDLIIYGSSFMERLETRSIENDINRFRRGRRPKDGKYFTPEEFFKKYYRTDGAETTNSNYRGVQFLQTAKYGDVWLYYYPIDKIGHFNRIDTDILSIGVVEKCLENGGFIKLPNMIKSNNLLWYYYMNPVTNTVIIAVSEPCEVQHFFYMDAYFIGTDGDIERESLVSNKTFLMEKTVHNKWTSSKFKELVNNIHPPMSTFSIVKKLWSENRRALAKIMLS